MDSIASLKLTDLKRELKARNLPITGTKQILMDRLLEAMSTEKSANDDSNIDDLLDEDSMLGEEESDSGSDNVNADIAISSPTATVPPVSLSSPTKQESLKRPAVAAGQNGNSTSASPPTKKKIILNRQPVPEAAPQVLPVASAETILASKAAVANKEVESATGEKPAVIKLNEVAAAPITDKLKLRQEKFKTDSSSPTTDTSDKLQKRAERFGVTATATTTTGNSVPSGVDAEKLAKRQERFGVTTDDKMNDSRQRRAERFGLAEKSAAAAAPNPNAMTSAEIEEKKKLRAARFAAMSS